MNRITIKQTAREAYRKNRSNAILALVIPMVIFLVAYAIPFGLFMATEQAIWMVLLVIVILLWTPITVGIFHFYRTFKDNPDASLKLLLKGHENLLRNLLRLLQTLLFIYLWMLLLVIPGWVAMFTYAMVPFILADDEIRRDGMAPRPTQISRKMMKGHRLELFVMMLSFLGWMILGALTLHILTILFVGPYIYLSLAEFYDKVRGNLPDEYFVKDTT